MEHPIPHQIVSLIRHNIAAYDAMINMLKIAHPDGHKTIRAMHEHTMYIARRLKKLTLHWRRQQRTGNHVL